MTSAQSVMLVVFPLLIIGVIIFFTVSIKRAMQEKKQATGAVSSTPVKKTPRTKRDKSEEGIRDERRLTYRYADDYLFIDGKNVYTAVTLGSWTDENASDEEIAAIAEAPESVLETLARDSHTPVSCHLRVFPRILSPEEWANDMIKRAPNPSSKYANLMRAQAIYLAKEERTTYEQVLIVKLGSLSSKTALQPADREITDPVRAWSETSEFAGIFDDIRDDMINPESIGEWTVDAKEVHDRFASLNGTPLRRADLIQLIRTPLYGHLPVPEVESFGQQDWGPGQFQLALDFNAKRRGNVMEIEQPDPVTGVMTKSYQTTLVVANFPRVTQFSRANAWCKLATEAKEMLGFHVNVSWRFDLLPYAKIRDIASKTLGNLKDEITDKKTAGGTPTNEQLENRDMAQKWVNDIEENQLCGLEGQIRFIVAAPSATELSRRVARFKDHMSNRAKMTLHQPGHMQVALLREALPGNGPRALISPYMRITDLTLFGYGLPMSSAKVGDYVEYDDDGRQKSWIGNYMGDTEEGKLLCHFSPRSTTARNGGGATVAVFGRTGAGKTATVTRQFDELSEAGEPCWGLDPKDDIARFVLYRAFGPQVNEPGFEEEFRSGTVGTPESRFQPVDREYWDDSLIIDITRALAGSLDPFVLETSRDAARMLASKVLEQMFSPQEWNSFGFQTLVTDALNTVVEEEDDPTMYKIVLNLEAKAQAAYEARDGRGEEANIELLARRVRSYMKLPLARLAFSTTSAQSREDRIKIYRRTIITLPEINMPAGDPNEWSEEERMIAGIMQLVLRMMIIHSRRDRNAASHIFVDEAHVFAGYKAAVANLKTSMRMIRSLDGIMWLITQNASDLSKLDSGESANTDGASNQIQAMLIFGQRGTPDVESALKLASVQGNSRIIKSIRKLKAGQFVFVDPLFRIATVQANRIFDVIVRGTDTTATTRVESQSHPVPLDPMDWTYERVSGVEGKVTARELLEKYPHLLRSTPDEITPIPNEEVAAA